MTVATAFRNAITSIINNLGSTVTITPVTITQNTGGYDPNTESNGTAVSATAVTDRELKKTGMIPIGSLDTSGLRLWLKSTETIALDTSTTRYKAVWQSATYDVREYKPFYIQDTLVAQMVILAKRL